MDTLVIWCIFKKILHDKCLTVSSLSRRKGYEYDLYEIQNKIKMYIHINF